MGVSRRDFLKISGGSLLMGSVASQLSPAEAQERESRIKGATETTTVCPYCSVGCGILVHTKDGKIVNTEGDPDHPISEGTLCSKGASVISLVNNETRLAAPLYRAPGAAEWKKLEWDEALDMIARRIKDTRDRTFKSKSKSKVKENCS